MKIHALTIKIRAKKPNNDRNCERSASAACPIEPQVVLWPMRSSLELETRLLGRGDRVLRLGHTWAAPGCESEAPMRDLLPLGMTLVAIAVTIFGVIWMSRHTAAQDFRILIAILAVDLVCAYVIRKSVKPQT